MAIAEIRDLIDDLVRDSAGRITPDARERALGLALVRYSADRPRQIVEDVIADGSAIIPLPSEWAEGQSKALTVEYPVDLQPQRVLPGTAWQQRQQPLGAQIRLTDTTAVAGAAVRITYTTPHQLDDDVDTIPPAHSEAVASYAAGLLAEQIATLHAEDSDSTIQADRVDKSHPAREWAKRAKEYRNRYFATLGISINAQGVEEPSIEAAGVVVELELPTTHGYGRLWRR